VVLSRPGRSGGDEPGVEAIGGCVNKRRALDTRLSSALLRDLSNVPRGLTEIAEAKQVRKTNQTGILYQFKKRGPKVDPHVSNDLVDFFFERFRSVGLGISQTNADSQWNPVYNAFHRIIFCRNETIRQ